MSDGNLSRAQLVTGARNLAAQLRAECTGGGFVDGGTVRDLVAVLDGLTAEPHPIVADDLVALADRAYWDKFQEADTFALQDGDEEALVAMRAALEAVSLETPPAPLLEAAAEATWGWRHSSLMVPSPADDPDWDDLPEVRRNAWRALTRTALVAAYRVDAPKPLLDREAVHAWIREEINRAIKFHAATNGTGHQVGADCDGWVALTAVLQMMHDDAHELLERE